MDTYIYIYIFITCNYMQLCIYIYIYIYTCTHTYIYIYIHICMCISIYIYIYIYTYTYIHIQLHTYCMCIKVYMQSCAASPFLQASRECATGVPSSLSWVGGACSTRALGRKVWLFGKPGQLWTGADRLVQGGHGWRQGIQEGSKRGELRERIEEPKQVRAS